MRFATMLLFTVLAACTSFLVIGTLTASGAQYDLDLELSDATDLKVAHDGDPVQFNLTLEHNGTSPSEQVLVEVVNASSWHYVLVASTRADVYTSTSNLTLLMEAGEVAPLSVTFTAPFTAQNQTYWFGLRASVVEDPSRNETLDIGVSIPQVAGLLLDTSDPPPNMTYGALPPSTISIDYTLYNVGNGPDSFQIDAVSSREAEGWTVSYGSGLNDTGFTDELAADPLQLYPYSFTVKVSIPAGTAADVRANLTTSATSSFDPTLPGESITVELVSLQIFNFKVWIDGPDIDDGYPGDEVEFELKIWNQGNGPDNFTIEAIFDVELAPGFEVALGPSNLTIGANETEPVTYTVRIPETASKKEYRFLARVYSQSDELVPETMTFKVDVAQVFGIELSCEDPDRVTNPGGNLEFEFEVTNTGNGLDSIVINEIQNTPFGWLTYTQPPEVTLLQAQTESISVIVIVPSQFEDVPSLTYTLTVPAVSGRGPAEDSLDLHISINPFWRIEWMHSGYIITNPERPVAQPGSVRPRPTIDLLDNTSTTVTLSIKNFGNADDLVTVDVVNDNDNLEIEVNPTELSLRSVESKDVAIKVTTLKNGPSGFFVFKLRAFSSDESLVTRVIPMDAEVIPVFEDDDFASLSYSDPEDDDYSFTFTEEKEGGKVIESQGRLDRTPSVDITRLEATLDPANGTVCVTLECQELAEEEGTVYWVYFVNRSHRQSGPLLVPRDHQRGVFKWNNSNPSTTYLGLWYSDGEWGSTMDIASLQVNRTDNVLTFTLPSRAVRRAGVEPGSDFGVYAYAEKVKESGGDDYTMKVAWDSAGLGAKNPPDKFTNEAEGSPTPAFLAPLAIALAAAMMLAVARGRRR